MWPFVISATIPYIAKTFAEQKLCSATMEPTHQLYMQPMWPNSTHPQRSRATLPKLLWRILTNEVQSRCIAVQCIALQTVFSTERLSTRGKTHVAICGFRKPTYTVKHFQGKFSNLYSAIMFPTHQFNSAIEVENSPPTNSAQGTEPKATLDNTIQTTCKAMTFAVPNTKSNSSFLALLTSRVTAVTPRATDGVLQLKPCIATTTALNLPPRSQTPKSKIPRCTNCLQLSTHQRRAHDAGTRRPKVLVPPHWVGEMEGDDDDEWQGATVTCGQPVPWEEAKMKGIGGDL